MSIKRVTYEAYDGRIRARLHFDDGTRTTLGTYATREDAEAAYAAHITSPSATPTPHRLVQPGGLPSLDREVTVQGSSALVAITWAVFI